MTQYIKVRAFITQRELNVLVTEEVLQDQPSTTGRLLEVVQNLRESDRSEYIEIVQNIQGRIREEGTEVSAIDALDYVLGKLRETAIPKTTDVSEENRKIIDEAWKKAHQP